MNGLARDGHPNRTHETELSGTNGDSRGNFIFSGQLAKSNNSKHTHTYDSTASAVDAHAHGLTLGDIDKSFERTVVITMRVTPSDVPCTVLLIVVPTI